MQPCGHQTKADLNKSNVYRAEQHALLVPSQVPKKALALLPPGKKNSVKQLQCSVGTLHPECVEHGWRHWPTCTWRRGAHGVITCCDSDASAVKPCQVSALRKGGLEDWVAVRAFDFDWLSFGTVLWSSLCGQLCCFHVQSRPLCLGFRGHCPLLRAPAMLLLLLPPPRNCCRCHHCCYNHDLPLLGRLLVPIAPNIVAPSTFGAAF